MSQVIDGVVTNSVCVPCAENAYEVQSAAEDTAAYETNLAILTDAIAVGVANAIVNASTDTIPLPKKRVRKPKGPVALKAAVDSVIAEAVENIPSEPPMAVKAVVDSVIAAAVDAIPIETALPKTKRVSKVKKAGRGRPTVYTGPLLKGIVKLLRTHKNATVVRNILSANGKKKADLIALRTAVGIDEKHGISMPTLLNIAKAAKPAIALHRGRPDFKTVAKRAA